MGAYVEPGYEAVAAAFESNFERHGEVGAACCVHVDGRLVVDLWGGTADRETNQPYGADTLQLVFSATKGATAACALLLVERGVLDLASPVAQYWPEFAQAGKADISLRCLLSHRAGLPTLEADLGFDEVLGWSPVVEALAAQPPVWPPDTAHGYHALTFGWLVGEVVRRVSGQSLGGYFAEELAGPLGLDFWIGLPAEHEPRVAPLIPYPEPENPDEKALLAAFLDPATLTGRALTGPDQIFTDLAAFNGRRIHAAELPSMNGITTARSLSRLYAALAGELDGRRLFSASVVDAARTEQVRGTDAVLLMETAYGLGFQLPSFTFPDTGPGSFGHVGAGGALGFADPGRGIGFGYVTNAMQRHVGGDPRQLGLVAAVRESVAGTRGGAG